VEPSALSSGSGPDSPCRSKALLRTAPAQDDVVLREHARGAVWVEPVLVGEVAYRTLTPDCRLRHPSWRGLRPDCQANEASVPDH
jgi:bifunctional non-homologous end joining protein LigD